MTKTRLIEDKGARRLRRLYLPLPESLETGYSIHIEAA